MPATKPSQPSPAEATPATAPAAPQDVGLALPLIWSKDFRICGDQPVLGAGAFAEVLKVQHRASNRCFAVKMMHRPNFVLRGIEDQLENEIDAMAEVTRQATAQDARNVLRLIDVQEEGEYVFLLLDLCEEGDLLGKLRRQRHGRFLEAAALTWARQLFSGLKTLHDYKIIHRDIKPDNLLCTAQGVLKIADFGWCAFSQDRPTCLAGTFQYMAPEVLCNAVQTEKADVWSAGVTLYQLLLGRPLLATYLGPGATNLTEVDPHAATQAKQRLLLQEIVTHCPPPPELRPACLSEPCWDFLCQALEPEVKRRPSSAECLAHPWLVGEEDLDSVANPADVATISCSVGSATPILPVSPEPSQASAMLVEEPAQTRPQSLSPPLTPRVPPGATTSPSRGVPTPQRQQEWDSSRNMAYSPPLEQALKLDDDSASAGRLSPERASPQHEPVKVNYQVVPPASARGPTPPLSREDQQRLLENLSTCRAQLQTVLGVLVNLKPETIQAGTGESPAVPESLGADDLHSTEPEAVAPAEPRREATERRSGALSVPVRAPTMLEPIGEMLASTTAPDALSATTPALQSNRLVLHLPEPGPGVEVKSSRKPLATIETPCPDALSATLPALPAASNRLVLHAPQPNLVGPVLEEKHVRQPLATIEAPARDALSATMPVLPGACRTNSVILHVPEPAPAEKPPLSARDAENKPPPNRTSIGGKAPWPLQDAKLGPVAADRQLDRQPRDLKLTASAAVLPSFCKGAGLAMRFPSPLQNYARKAASPHPVLRTCPPARQLSPPILAGRTPGPARRNVSPPPQVPPLPSCNVLPEAATRAPVLCTPPQRVQWRAAPGQPGPAPTFMATGGAAQVTAATSPGATVALGRLARRQSAPGTWRGAGWATGTA